MGVVKYSLGEYIDSLKFLRVSGAEYTKSITESTSLGSVEKLKVSRFKLIPQNWAHTVSDRVNILSGLKFPSLKEDISEVFKPFEHTLSFLVEYIEL
jgi:hypothetical protein